MPSRCRKKIEMKDAPGERRKYPAYLLGGAAASGAETVPRPFVMRVLAVIGGQYNTVTRSSSSTWHNNISRNSARRATSEERTEDSLALRSGAQHLADLQAQTL